MRKIMDKKSIEVLKHFWSKDRTGETSSENLNLSKLGELGGGLIRQK